MKVSLQKERGKRLRRSKVVSHQCEAAIRSLIWEECNVWIGGKKNRCRSAKKGGEIERRRKGINGLSRRDQGEERADGGKI